MSGKQITLTPLTPEVVGRLKRAYDKALAEGKTREDVIVVDDHELVVGYLKYLLEYAASLGIKPA